MGGDGRQQAGGGEQRVKGNPGPRVRSPVREPLTGFGKKRASRRRTPASVLPFPGRSCHLRTLGTSETLLLTILSCSLTLALSGLEI